MSKGDLFLNGSPLLLGKRIGRGGEGEVYLATNHPQTAVKIYTGARNTEREAKVTAMVQHSLAERSGLVAFPKGIVKSKSGAFAGFTMNLVDGHRPLHEAYGPKSRKTYFPKADFRFLVRAAANVARATGQVHQSPCVIGDINHSGILVSEDATVALIDADSFQFEANGKCFPCLVGVPDFTPPELQGASFKGVARTKHHDHFGLAVAVFQLLFMGRHPYSGRHTGADLSLEQIIAKNLFAYSRLRKTSMIPPAFVANLDDFPSDVGNAFERAFGDNPASRPDAREWVEVLKRLEARLSRCGANPIHYYPSDGKSCPWCRMENSIGVLLFVSPLLRPVSAGVHSHFNIDQVVADIESVSIPGPHYAKMPIFPNLKASSEAKRSKASIVWRRLLAAGSLIAATIALIRLPNLFLLWPGLIWFAWYQFLKINHIKREWQELYTRAGDAVSSALTEWERQSGITRLHEIRSSLQNSATEFRGLAALKSQALGRLKTERHSRQLYDYLDQFLLSSASIPGIAHGKTVTLASHGVESAADIDKAKILNIPGFGEATTAKLLAWRKSHEGRFVYNPAPLPADSQIQAKIENEFDAKANTLMNRLSAGGAELRQALLPVQNRLNSEDAQLNQLAAVRAQVEADLQFLGISKRARASTQASVPFTFGATTPYTKSGGRTAATGRIQCPRCGSAMVRRTARRGRNAGGSFWGCSKYPRCKGTRP